MHSLWKNFAGKESLPSPDKNDTIVATMRWFNILQGIAALAATVGLVVLFYYNIFYAVAAVLLFYVGKWIYLVFQRHKERTAAQESARWHRRVD